MRDEADSSPQNSSSTRHVASNINHGHHHHPLLHRPEACKAIAVASSSSSSLSTTSSASPRRRQSGLADSPLRQALSKSPPPPLPPTTTASSSSSSSTPLLKASLNSPPVAHASVANGNGSSLENGSAATSSNGRQTTSGTSTTSARKEKHRSQSCFQCPICKKRFQRHIAMNAHFQNEHIGQVQNGAAKVCRLCPPPGGFRSDNMAKMRAHILNDHHIDLDAPATFVVDPDNVKMEQQQPTQNGRGLHHGKYRQDAYRPAVDITLTSDDPARDLTSSASSSSASTPSSSSPSPPSLASPLRTSEASGLPPLISGVTIKKEASSADAAVSEENGAGEMEEARDLTVRKRLKRSAADEPPPLSPIPGSSAAASAVNSASAVAASQWQCQHCNIVFPNQTLYFLHRGFHGGDPSDPWRCNGCGHSCRDMYDFNTHLVSDPHN